MIVHPLNLFALAKLSEKSIQLQGLHQKMRKYCGVTAWHLKCILLFDKACRDLELFLYSIRSLIIRTNGK